MKAVYDARSDTLTLEFKPGPVAECDEDKPGVILDYDASGNLVGIEILNASQRVAEARSMEFQVAGWMSRVSKQSVYGCRPSTTNRPFPDSESYS